MEAESIRVAKVYHQCDPSNATLADLGLAEFPQWPTGYVMVAMIEVTSRTRDAQLDEIFQRTQHSRNRWFVARGIVPTPLARRSTMVGDIVTLPSGVAYRCRGDRWERAFQPGAHRPRPNSAAYAEA